MNKIVCFGEVLMRLSIPNKELFYQCNNFEVTYGGSEANAAVSLSRFGYEVSMVTRLPDNELGQNVVSNLKKYGVNIENIIYGGSRLGLYFLEQGAGQRNSKVIYDRDNSSAATIQPGMVDWKKVLEGASWFHFSGISAAISESSAQVCMEALSHAKENGMTISVDMNYREKLWKYGKRPQEVMPVLLQYCDIIFGGIDAPEKMLGIVPESKSTTKGKLTNEDLISVAGQMLQKFPRAKLFASSLRWIFSSDHHQLQGMLYDRKTLTLSRVFDMPGMVDRIGGGDAFMAGLIHGIMKYENDYSKAIDFATAASSLKHYTHGDFNLSTEKEVTDIMSGENLGINR